MKGGQENGRETETVMCRRNLFSSGWVSTLPPALRWLTEKANKEAALIHRTASSGHWKWTKRRWCLGVLIKCV